MSLLAPAQIASAHAAELSRIVSLPIREPLDCEREQGTRRWAPQAQALIDFITAKYTRGPRIACACRTRYIERTSAGLLVRQDGRPGSIPQLPQEVSLQAFVDDNNYDEQTVDLVSDLRIGARVELPGLGYPTCITELNPVQAWSLWELPQAQGIFGMVSVGGGKTAMGILAPLAMPHLRTWAALIKPDQRLHYRRMYIRLREHFRVPSIVFDKTGMKGSYLVDDLSVPVLHIIPYSVLSSMKSTLLLEDLNPDGVVDDEAHLIANKESSRTMRWLRAMAKRSDRVVLCWSGSMVKRSVRDCAHLSAYSLGLGSPFPIGDNATEAMSNVIDPRPNPDRTSSTARALQEAFGRGVKGDNKLFEIGLAGDGGIRSGFRGRVVRTLGVISTKSSSVSCSIAVTRREVPKIPDHVRAALLGVRDTDMPTRPDGDPLVEATEIALTARTVGSGYFYFWAFPHATDEDRAPDGTIDQWYAARKAFYKELRTKVRMGEPHLDSKKLCENAAERAWRNPPYEGDLPVWPAVTWPAWAAIRDRVQPVPKVKWLDDFFARDAAEWAKAHRGIVWCLSSSFGRKVAELAGINYHGGGPEAEARILAEDGSRSIVASIKAHASGRDGLQFKFYKQYIAEMFPSADGFEQLFGRLAREGQPEDTIETWMPMHTSENREALRSAIALAEFIESTTPNRQAILAADFDWEI